MKTLAFLCFSPFLFGQDTLSSKVVVPKSTNSIEREVIDMCDCSEDAQFPGGPIAMQRYIQNKLVYPDCEVTEMGSRVYVTFVVETNGELTNIEIYKAHCSEMEEVLIQLFENMPPWWPGTSMHGEDARTRVQVPIQICVL